MEKFLTFLVAISPVTFTLFRGRTTASVLLLMLLALSVLKIIKGNFLSIIGFFIIVFIILLNIIGAYNFDTILLTKPEINNYVIQLLILILYFNLYCRKEKIEELNKNIYRYKYLLLIEVIMIELIEFWNFIFKKGFQDKWGGVYFAGTTGGQHQTAYLLLLIVIVIAFLSKIINNKLLYILYIPPLILLIFTGARTPTICAFILVLAILNGFNNKYITVLVYLLILIIFIYNYENMPLFKKMMSTKNTNILSGRDVFWESLFSYFKQSDLTRELFGNGIYYTTLINYHDYNMAIWAHNDFLDIAISLGLFVLSYYIYNFTKYFKFIYNNLALVNAIMIFSAYFLLAFFDGLFMYTSIIVSIPYLSLYVYNNCNDNHNKSYTMINKKGISHVI